MGQQVFKKSENNLIKYSKVMYLKFFLKFPKRNDLMMIRLKRKFSLGSNLLLLQ